MNESVECRLQDSPIAWQWGKNVRCALIVTALLALALAPQVFAQRPGEVTDAIVTAADTSQSYAVYLPSTYNTQRQWPVIFAFDPAARGRVPVELFRPAAERRGHIVVGSNNSRNGPAAPQVNAFLAVVHDVQKRFSVDRQRFYAAGFSGGARVAGRAGFFCDGCIRAVIACGAGLPQGMNARQRAQLPPYFFAVGGDDFNYFEVLDAARSLQSARVVVFGGSHDWPPADVLSQAVEWIYSGAKPAEIPPLSATEVKQRKLQAQLTRNLSALISVAAQQRDGREQNLGDARREMATLRTKRERAGELDASVFRRALGQAVVQTYEIAEGFERKGDHELAAGFYEVAAEGAPENMELAYRIASAWAAAGDKKKTFRVLRRAIELGFNDRRMLAADEHFDRIRTLPEFQTIITSIR